MAREPTPEEAAIVAALAAEHRAMHAAIAKAMQAWAALESNMATLLALAMHPSDENIGRLTYFAPSNTETRIRILDKIMIYRLGNVGFLASVWQKTLDKVNKHKASRNQIAHGVVFTASKNKKHKIRIGSPYLDMTNPNQLKPDQFPGMSPNDVNIAADVIWEDSSNVNDLCKIFRLSRAKKATVEALQEILPPLAARLKIEIPQPDARNSARLIAPLPSSEGKP